MDSLKNEVIANENNTDLLTDPFGFHQLIIAATFVGNLFALDTLGGSIVWKRGFRSHECPSLSNVFVTRTVGHYPPEAIALAEC